MDDKIKINLRMAGYVFPVTTLPENEEMVRKAAKEVDVRLNEFMNQYGKLSKEVALAKIAYDYALENLQLREAKDTQPYDRKIDELTRVLEEYVKKQ
jgi:cell division protein ZapA